jgi:hypothetical protein
MAAIWPRPDVQVVAATGRNRCQRAGRRRLMAGCPVRYRQQTTDTDTVAARDADH